MVVLLGLSDVHWMTSAAQTNSADDANEYVEVMILMN